MRVKSVTNEDWHRVGVRLGYPAKGVFRAGTVLSQEYANFFAIIDARESVGHVDTGTLLPAGASVRFQMHYTPNGKAIVDNSRIGIYFHDEPPKYKLSGTALVNTKIKIPANTKAHTETKSMTLKRDVLLYSLLPHSHFRGTASDFIAYFPDGTEEILLSVPAYDFN